VAETAALLFLRESGNASVGFMVKRRLVSAVGGGRTVRVPVLRGMRTSPTSWVAVTSGIWRSGVGVDIVAAIVVVVGRCERGYG
jgi:hypothetical protein